MSIEVVAILAVVVLYIAQAVERYLWQRERADLQRLIKAEDLRDFTATKIIEQRKPRANGPPPKSGRRIPQGHFTG